MENNLEFKKYKFKLRKNYTDIHTQSGSHLDTGVQNIEFLVSASLKKNTHTNTQCFYLDFVFFSVQLNGDRAGVT